jgi:hypothetical protein
MGDSIFVVLPEGAKPPKSLEVILSPKEFGFKSADEKNIKKIKDALRKKPLRVYDHERAVVGIGMYADAYAENGKIHATYEMNGAKHNAT